MTTTETPLLRVEVTTSRRDDNTIDIFARFGDDDRVHLGTAFKGLTGYWTAHVGDDVFSSVRKFEIVLEVCRLAGPKHFTGAVYRYGRYAIEA